jgi:hypothetical protein
MRGCRFCFAVTLSHRAGSLIATGRCDNLMADWYRIDEKVFAGDAISS